MSNTERKHKIIFNAEILFLPINHQHKLFRLTPVNNWKLT